MTQLPLFAFGTLRQGECNHHYLAGRFDEVTTARLVGFARVASLMIVRQPDGVVFGELFRLSPSRYAQTMQGCDDLEELPRGELVGHEYRRIAVRVETDQGGCIAWAYVHPATEPESDLATLCDEELRRLA